MHTGFGTLTERDGGCYEGEFHGNRRHGEGSQVYSNGDQYKGDWVEGRRHGQGILRCTDGTVYDVSFTGHTCTYVRTYDCADQIKSTYEPLKECVLVHALYYD